MKKIALTTITLFLFLVTSLVAQNDAANEDYIKAVTTADANQRVQLLKEYIAKYGGKGTQYENFVYSTLCLTPYKGKTDRETISYGEKALALGGLDEITKYQILVTIAGLCANLGQNLNKAKDYALQAIQTAQANKNNRESETPPAQWNQFIGAGYFVHGQVLEKEKDLKGAVNSYINSYNILKNPQIANSLAKAGKTLYDYKFYADAEKALQVAATALKDYGSTLLYAKTLHRNGKKEEALKHYKLAYAKQRSGEVAYNIGIILAGNGNSNPLDSKEAIGYLLEASFLSPSNSQKAMSLAESLFFTYNPEIKYNEKVKELAEKSEKIEALTNSFNKKFGEKSEEELSDSEKKEMKSILAQIESEKKAIEKLQAEQDEAINKFNTVIAQTKQKLGIK